VLGRNLQNVPSAFFSLQAQKAGYGLLVVLDTPAGLSVIGTL
jgi:hypothetical protein